MFITMCSTSWITVFSWSRGMSTLSRHPGRFSYSSLRNMSISPMAVRTSYGPKVPFSDLTEFPGVAVRAQQLDVLGVVSSFGVFLPALDVIQMQLSVRSATAHTAAPVKPQDSIPQFLPALLVLGVHC